MGKKKDLEPGVDIPNEGESEDEFLQRRTAERQHAALSDDEKKLYAKSLNLGDGEADDDKEE